MKLKKFLVMTLVVSSLLGASSVYADGYLYAWTLGNVTETVTTTAHVKNDSDQNWYLTIEGGYSEMPSTIGTNNVFGVRARKGDDSTYASGYHTFSNLVTSYSMPYTASGITSGTSIYMVAKKDNSSTTSNGLWISGYWCP